MTDEEKQIELLKIEALETALKLITESRLVHDQSKPRQELLTELHTKLNKTGLALYPDQDLEYWLVDDETRKQMDKKYADDWDALDESTKLSISTKGEVLTFWAPKLVTMFEHHPDLQKWSTSEVFERVYFAVWDKVEEIKGEIENADIHNND